MIVFGGLVALLGVLLFQRALGMTIRANPRSRIPYFRGARTVPPGSMGLRALGAGLMVLGACVLGLVAWQWPLLVVLLGPAATFAGIFAHNRRVAHASGR